MKVCFLLTHVPDPRINRRIGVFRELTEAEVICTRRKSQDIWEPALKDIKHTILDIDLPGSKHLARRFFASLYYKKRAMEELKKCSPDVIYTDGLDTLQTANAYKNLKPEVKIIYEAADLRESYIEQPENLWERITGSLIRNAEKKGFRGVEYVALTSRMFFEKHYVHLISEDRVIYVPNMPDPEVFACFKKKEEGPFTVGFIGGIRYLAQMKMLVDAAEEAGCKVLFAGAGGTSEEYVQISEYCRGKEFVSFTGKYDYNSDIAELYGSVDCVYAVYNADNANVRIALPNKLYESVLCCLPIIVAKNTYLSRIVEEWGVGVSVGHKDKEELTGVLKKLALKDRYYRGFTEQCGVHRDEVDPTIYNGQLKAVIRKLII